MRRDGVAVRVLRAVVHLFLFLLLGEDLASAMCMHDTRVAIVSRADEQPQDLVPSRMP